MNQPDFTAHVLTSLTDDTWIKHYAAKMGETELYNYKNEVYKMLYNLQVGQWVSIPKLVKPENTDLFVKIACCFISESKASYFFYDQYTIIKHTFDAQQMEKTLALLERKRWENAAGKDGETAGSDSLRTSPVSAQASHVQN